MVIPSSPPPQASPPLIRRLPRSRFDTAASRRFPAGDNPRKAGSIVLPLEGIRVIALEHAVAAPICTRHLADLGADVIKVERPGEGDFARAYDNYVHGQASFFVWLNRGKRSITLDLKHPEAAPVLE